MYSFYSSELNGAGGAAVIGNVQFDRPKSNDLFLIRIK